MLLCFLFAGALLLGLMDFNWISIYMWVLCASLCFIVNFSVLFHFFVPLYLTLYFLFLFFCEIGELELPKQRSVSVWEGKQALQMKFVFSFILLSFDLSFRFLDHWRCVFDMLSYTFCVFSCDLMCVVFSSALLLGLMDFQLDFTAFLLYKCVCTIE